VLGIGAREHGDAQLVAAELALRLGVDCSLHTTDLRDESVVWSAMKSTVAKM
jgi:hypothetical protein